MPDPIAARGSDADYCLVWPDDGHSMVSHKPAHTTISIRRCTFCGWIDGADLERQRSEVVAEGRRQAVEAIRERVGDIAATEWAALIVEEEGRG